MLRVTISILGFESVFVVIFHAFYNEHKLLQFCGYHSLRMTGSAGVTLPGTCSIPLGIAPLITTAGSVLKKCQQGNLTWCYKWAPSLQPKFLGGEDFSAESCRRVGGREIVMQSGEGCNGKKGGCTEVWE